MKNKLVLSLALGLAGASSLLATEVHVYLTGSTAFRANAYSAAKNLFQGTPTIYYGNAAHGGADSGFSSSTASWVIFGTPITNITALAGNTLAVHGLFTGSIQGIQSVENQQALPFPDDTALGGTANGLAGGYVTNVPTIAFDDCSSTVTTYPVSGNYKEEAAAVIPFGFFKSQAGGVMTNVNNVSWEQAEYGIPAGYVPLSAWTYNQADTNTLIYLLQRTQDSGTRRSELADFYYQFNDPVGIYLFDKTNSVWYTPTVLNSVTNATAYASAPYGVVNGGTFNTANYNWGYGYVGGGDIKNALNLTATANTAIGYLSMSDGQGVGANWSNLLPFNGMWPTAAGAGIHGVSGYNDFSPITKGYYPLWSQLVLVFPKKPSLQAGQTIGDTQLGDQGQVGTFLGVFNAQTLTQPSLGGVPQVGSIENEIYKTETVPASYPNTAIRLIEMQSKRQSVGGTITPY